MQFADYATNEDARGGVGYDAVGNRIEHKYRFEDYWDIVFDSLGTITNPDSVSHEALVEDAGTMSFWGSLKQWCDENSGGTHRLIPALIDDSTGQTGILNSIVLAPGGLPDTARVVWVTMPYDKHDNSITEFYENSMLNPYGKFCDSVAADLFGAAYDSVDILIVVYAGSNIRAPVGRFVTTYGTTTSKPIILYSEKNNTADATRRIFGPHLSAMCHEYIHAFSYSENVSEGIFDYYWQTPNGGHNWMGFSVMSNGHCMQSNRPLHLDPWAKLLLGWVDAQILAADFHGEVTLPVVEKKYLGGKSKVAILPWSPSFTLTDGNLRNQRYLIVENRRALGFDQDVTANCNGEGASSSGGFLVWEYNPAFKNDSLQRGGLTVIEADTTGNVRFGTGNLTSENDFFDAPQVLSVWTQPGIVSAIDTSVAQAETFYPIPEKMFTPMLVQFSSYATDTDSNSFAVAMRQPYVDNAYAQCCNNQNKFATSGDSVAMVTTVRIDGSSGNGMVMTYLSGDNGLTWNTARRHSPFAFMSGQILQAMTENDASAPSITSIENGFHLVWQERRADSSYIIKTSPLLGDATALDTVVAPVGGPLPVIGGWGDKLQVYFATDSGIVERRSSDGGATWPPVERKEVSVGAILHGSLETGAGYPGRSIGSSHPSYGTEYGQEVLVWQYATSDTGVTLFLRKKYGSTADLYCLRDYKLDTLLNMRSPHVSFFDGTIHLAWVSQKNEKIAGVPLVHDKTAYMLWDFPSGPDSIGVTTFFNRKFNRNEVTVDPVVIASGDRHKPDSTLAWIMWSVNDPLTGDGARLRSNKLVSYADSQYAGWGQDHEIHGISSFVTRHPQVLLLGDTVLYSITKDNNPPHAILTNTLFHNQWDPRNPVYAEFEYYIADRESQRIQSSMNLGCPALTDSLQATMNIGQRWPRLEGFFALTGGTLISELALSEPFLFRSSDAVTWTLQYHQSPVYTPRDTVFIRGILRDSATLAEISGTSQFKIIPSCDDTTLALDFELPPQYWPERKTFLEVDVQGGAIDLPTRRLSMIVNILSEDTEQVPKPRASGVSRRNRGEAVTYVHPQPSSGRIRIGYRGVIDGPAMVYVYDALGRMALRTVLESSGTAQASVIVDLSGQPAGVYQYTIQSRSTQLGTGRIVHTR